MLAVWANRTAVYRLGRRSEDALFDLRVRLFEHIHRLSLADHSEERKGALTARVALSQTFPTVGALAPIYGTLVTSAIAMLIAVPVGLMIAFFLTELCPPVLRRPIGIAIELLAGIPSIIYGMWGLFVLAPFLQRVVQPGLIELFAPVPVLRHLFAGPPYGIGILTAGLVLAIMVLLVMELVHILKK